MLENGILIKIFLKLGQEIWRIYLVFGVPMDVSMVAKCLNAQPREIYFTSGGSESDNWAINAAAQIGARQNKKHIITTALKIQ